MRSICTAAFVIQPKCQHYYTFKMLRKNDFLLITVWYELYILRRIYEIADFMKSARPFLKNFKA
jgi:hypothetical protein